MRFFRFNSAGTITPSRKPRIYRLHGGSQWFDPTIAHQIPQAFAKAFQQAFPKGFLLADVTAKQAS